MCNSVKGGRNEGQDGLPPGHDVLVRQAQDHEPPRDCGGFAVSRPVRRARAPHGGLRSPASVLPVHVSPTPAWGLRRGLPLRDATVPRLLPGASATAPATP